MDTPAESQKSLSVESQDDVDFLKNFMAVQILLIDQLTKMADNQTVKKQDLTDLFKRLLKFETKLSAVTEKLVKIHEDKIRQLCNVMGKYGGTPGAFGVMNSPTDKVSLMEARWAISSSARVKDSE